MNIYSSITLWPCNYLISIAGFDLFDENLIIGLKFADSNIRDELRTTD